MPDLALKFNKLLDTVKKNNPKADLELVSLAFDFAKGAHAGQKRMSGEDYIFHPLATAQTLADLKLSVPIIIAGLLHDVPEDTAKTLDDIRNNFGPDIANMVEGITKLSSIKYRGVERYIENLRRMFVAMASDLRVILIKFADRLHNLQTLYALPRNKQLRIANEVMEIYAPIANRLGMYEMKGRLEEEAFKYLNPKEYNWVKNIIEQNYHEKEKSLNIGISIIKKELQFAGIAFIDVYGRAKQLFSLYNKLLKYDRDISRVYDFIAMRVIVKDIPDCYAALGIIHKKLKPLKGRIKDYIAQPKPNGYTSLHTTVFLPGGEIIEVQIRTQKMHDEAEFGIAAHWHYDERGPVKPSKDSLKWLTDLSDWQKEMNANLQFLENLKIDVFQDRIFVFTPKGEVIDLIAGSTPVDFAYHIHSQIGDASVGARINNHFSPLNTVLKSGDMVEIIIDKSKKYPSNDWLKFVKTPIAKSKIKSALAKRSLIDKLIKK